MGTNSMAPGAYSDAASKNGGRSIIQLVRQLKNNFIDKDLEIMPGLFFNQYKTLKRIHYYLNSEFEGGSIDENGNERYFHNIINHRNTQTTKNIDLDTKDVNVKTEKTDSYWRTFILRQEIRNWMKREKFAKILNEMAENLAKFGSVVWKNVKDEKGNNCIHDVDLRSLINDQSVKWLKDSQLVAERIVMNQKEMLDKIEDGWDRAEVKKALKNLNPGKNGFISETDLSDDVVYTIADGLNETEVYEVWGWVPMSYLPDSFKRNHRSSYPTEAKPASDPVETETAVGDEPEDYVYIMAVVSGVQSGTTEAILYCEEADPEDFPYKDVHMRKQVGRWLGVGNTEQLFNLQVRINELVNRVFMALRMGTIHLFQTRNQMAQKNLLQDAIDGDVLESQSPIEPIVTEIRAFAQYQQELQLIEMTADKMCNTPEVVTGGNLPANTPFRLGAQMSDSAAKYFEFIREDCGILLGEAIYDWVIPNIVEEMTEEHMLDLIGSVEELAEFEKAYQNTILLDEVKNYILNTMNLPTMDEFNLAAKTLGEQMQQGDKKFKVGKKYLNMDDFESYQIFVDPTGEQDAVAAETETLSNLLTIITSNPVIMQDPNARMIIGRIMENAHLSPIKLAGFVSAPVPGIPGAGGQQPMQPGQDPNAAPGAAAAPGVSKFATNPGDASRATMTR